jgi:hypothetical protein
MSSTFGRQDHLLRLCLRLLADDDALGGYLRLGLHLFRRIET